MEDFENVSTSEHILSIFYQSLEIAEKVPQAALSSIRRYQRDEGKRFI